MTLRERAKNAARRSHALAWEIAEILVEVQDTEQYFEWGFASWKEYVDRELGMSVRRTQYWMSVWRWHLSLPAPGQLWARSMSMSVLKLFTTYIDAASWPQWADRLRGVTVREAEAIAFGPVEDMLAAAAEVRIERALRETRGMDAPARMAVLRSLGLSAAQVGSLLGVQEEVVHRALRMIQVFVPAATYEFAKQVAHADDRRVGHEVSLTLQQLYDADQLAAVKKAG